MLDITTVSSLEYYREQNKESRRELGYYDTTDNEVADRGHSSLGEWEVLADEGAEPFHPSIVQGGRADWDIIDPLSRAVDPATGEAYYSRNSDKECNAQDFTFSAPKDVSLLHGAGRIGAAAGGENAELFQWLADMTQEAHNAGVRAGLKVIKDEEGFAVRFGKGGRERAPATFMAGMRFNHYVSRAGDMQLHSHVVFPNVARAADGSVRAWDNYKANSLKGLSSAVYRAEVSSHIKREAAKRGIEITFTKDGRNFKIEGLSDDVKNHFSKRRTTILDRMYAEGYSNTANNRKAAQIVSYDTREDKANLPSIEELTSRWRFELNSLGHTPDTLVEGMMTASARLGKERAEEWKVEQETAKAEGRELPADMDAYFLGKAVQKSIVGMTDMDAVFEQRKFQTALVEEVQTMADAETALALVEAAKEQSGFIVVGTKGRAKEKVFSDRQTLKSEFEILDIERQLRKNVAAVPMEIIEHELSEGILKNDGSGDRIYLKPEQAAAVIHLLGTDQLADAIGDAGTGKTTMMIVARRALEKDGYTVHLAAPTNKAVDGLRQEVGLPPERAYSVTRFIMEYEKGNLPLSTSDYVMLDEAGMIAREDWLKLDRIALETGARFGRVGDPKQLPPVAAGAPFRMTTEAFGSARLMEITRQNDTWARQASKDLASMNIRDGIMAYSDRDFFEIAANAEETQERALAVFNRLSEQSPGEVLLLAPTNAEVRRLNKAIQENKLELGILKGESVDFEAVMRGTSDKPLINDVRVYEGSRFILGESVKWNDERYSNNLQGVVVKIRKVDGEEPALTVNWDDGRTTTFQPSKFVGFREESDRLANIPKIALSDCMTEYAAQGVSVKHCVRVFSSATTAQSAYVGMTRHKETFHGIIDGGRIESEMAAKKGKTFTMSKDGTTNQEDDVPNTKFGKAEILEQFITETTRTNSKANACDLLGGPKEFLERHRDNYDANFEKPLVMTATVNEEKPQVRTPAERGESEIAELLERRVAAPKAVEADQLPFFNKTSPFGRPTPMGVQVGPKTAEIRAGGEMEIEKPTEIEKVGGNGGGLSKEERQDVARKRQKGWVEITKSDIDYIARTNLSDYLEKHHGFTYLEAYKGGGKDRGDGSFTPSYKGHILEHSTYGTVSVMETSAGGYAWALRDGTASGVIWDFETWRYGGKKGDGIRKAYDNLGLADPSSRRPLLPKEDRPTDYQRHGQEPPAKRTIAERIADGAVAKYEAVSDGLKGLRQRWQTMVQMTNSNKGVSEYLVRRGIDAETQARFPKQIGTEMPWARDNPNGVAFAHRDLEGNIWNYERKGEKKEGDKRSFSKMCKGTKRLGLLGKIEDPSVIYVCESTVDGLSLFQRDGRPKGALIASTYGEGSDEGYRDLHELARRYPNTPIHAAMDGDSAGRAFAARVEEIASLARGIENKNTVDRQPPEGFKDWNDAILNKRWEAKDKAINDEWTAALEADRAKGQAERKNKAPTTPAPDFIPEHVRAAERLAKEVERRRKKEELEASVEQKGPRR